MVSFYFLSFSFLNRWFRWEPDGRPHPRGQHLWRRSRRKQRRRQWEKGDGGRVLTHPTQQGGWVRWALGMERGRSTHQLSPGFPGTVVRRGGHSLWSRRGRRHGLSSATPPGVRDGVWQPCEEGRRRFGQDDADQPTFPQTQHKQQPGIVVRCQGRFQVRIVQNSPTIIIVPRLPLVSQKNRKSCLLWAKAGLNF